MWSNYWRRIQEKGVKILTPIGELGGGGLNFFFSGPTCPPRSVFASFETFCPLRPSGPENPYLNFSMSRQDCPSEWSKGGLGSPIRTWFLGRGCNEALFSEKKGFSVKRGEAIQWIRGLVRICTGKAIQWRGSGHSLNRRTLKTEKLLSSSPSRNSDLTGNWIHDMFSPSFATAQDAFAPLEGWFTVDLALVLIDWGLLLLNSSASTLAIARLAKAGVESQHCLSLCLSLSLQ